MEKKTIKSCLQYIEVIMKVGVFSFFSGLGLLDLGFESFEAIDVLNVSEFNQAFLNAYVQARSKIYVKEPEYGYHQQDIRCLVEPKEINFLKNCLKEAKKKYDHVGFIGGPPCPDFSIAGKNLGQEGENGKLSKTYIELICKVQPDFFLFENVKGLYRTKKHRLFFEEIKSNLIRSGYCLGERLINSIEYGVPQDRERIIVVGFKNKIYQKKLKISCNIKLLEEQHLQWNKYIKYPKDMVFSKPWPEQNEFCEFSSLSMPKDIIKELTIQHWFDRNDVNHHPNASLCFKPREALIRFQTIPEGDVSKKSFKRLHRWRYSPTAAYGNNEVHLHPFIARRINVAEALAIQSLPKNFILSENTSLTDMFKMIGNGVPFLAASGLAQMILLSLGCKVNKRF